MSIQDVPSQTTSVERDHHLQQRGPVHVAEDGSLRHQPISSRTPQRSHPRRRRIRKW